MKAAGHELKSAIRYYYACQHSFKSDKPENEKHIIETQEKSDRIKICVPLMVTIDFRGWRLTALSVLPISKKSLIYGSSDGGKTVLNRIFEFNSEMEAVAKKLNIKGHYIKQTSKKNAQKIMLHAPADIEGHLGTDQRYYLIDFARVFPPTSTQPYSPKNHILYQLFRPEFIAKLDFPLSSDAMTKFQHPDEAESCRQENYKATDLLLFEAEKLTKTLDHNIQNGSLSLSDLTPLLHRNGINIRLLGLMRNASKNKTISNLFLVEMTARSIKNILREKMRTIMRNQRGTVSQDPAQKVVLDLFNTVLGWTSLSGMFWSSHIKQKIM